MSLWKKYYEYPKGSKQRKLIENFFKEEKYIDSYEGIYIYSGRSTKIKKGNVIMIEDYGNQCKIKDIDGNIAKVAKSTLQTTLSI